MPAPSVEHIALDLIDMIYGAACDPALWPQFVEAVLATFPGIMFSVEMATRHPHFAINGAIFSSYPEEFALSYVQHYHKISPYLPLFSGMEVGQIARLSQLMSPAEVKKSPFYHEWLKPVGDFTHGTAAVLVRDAGRMLRASIDIPDRMGELEAPLARLLGIIGPHLVRAVEVNDRLTTATLTRQGLDGLLGRIDGPAFIVAAAGRLLQSNGAGERLLNAGALVRRSSTGQLAFQAPRQDAVFRRALAAACDPAGAGSEVTARVTCPRTGDATLMVLPLSSATTAPSPSQPGRLALVIIRPLDAPPRCPRRLLRQHFGLTAAEAEVAALIAGGRDVADIAEAHGVSQKTVRNQLAAIMDKMNIRRQAELIILIASLVPGLALEE